MTELEELRKENKELKILVKQLQKNIQECLYSSCKDIEASE